MMTSISRRDFVAGLGVLAAGAPLSFAAGARENPVPKLSKSPFKIAVITDEISQDFGHACEVAARQFGMGWVEVRSLWKKNIVNLDEAEFREANRILKANNLRVTDIASPLFKTDWPGAPESKFSERDSFNADFTFEQQGEVLDRAIAAAKQLSTDHIRCFDFWRLEDQAPYRKAIDETLQNAAEKAGKQGFILILENESACNTATGAEAAKMLAGVPSPHLMLNWDPGNAARLGEKPYPDGYNLLPKNRIGHCHCKDVMKTASGLDWAPMGKGIIDWVGQFAALKRDGYHHVVSLETHWGGAGTPEASSVQSWAGMKECLEKAGAL
jgi:L-ribulose-5-phosphate 3-epimerase